MSTLPLNSITPQPNSPISNAPVNISTSLHTFIPARCVYCGGDLHTYYQPALHEGARGAHFVTCMQPVGTCPMAGMTIGAAKYYDRANLARYLTPGQLAEIELPVLMHALNVAMQTGGDIDTAARAINACWRRLDAESGAS